MTSSKPEILQQTVTAESRLFKLERLQLRFGNGEERQFERICGKAAGGAVMIVPLLNADTVLLIREYGAGIGDYVLGFPKGAVAAGEDLLQTANRELLEETGYGAGRLTVLCQFSASPSYFNSMMHLVLAEDLYTVAERPPGDEPELLTAIPWRLDQIDQLLQQPEFHEARSIAALLLLERRLRFAAASEC